MKALGLVECQVGHREVNTHDGNDFDHLISDQVEKTGAPLALDVPQRDDSDLLSFIFIEERQLEATAHIDLKIVLVRQKT